jgi:hypothetical protein
MPFMKNGKRDYKRELEWEKEKDPTRVKDRAARNGARAIMKKEGKVKVGDGKDVGHKRAMSKGGKTTRGNIEVQSASSNRSFSRNKDGSMKSETSKREKRK